MDSRQRVVLLLLAVAVAVAAVVVVGGGSDDEEGVIDTRTQVTTTATTAEPAETTETTPPKPPEPEIPTIEIRDGEPVGGVERLRYRKGGDVVFRVRSDETTGHVHLHGYDVLKDLEPNGTVTFEVAADVDGRFEVELEDTATVIAEVEVLP